MRNKNLTFNKEKLLVIIKRNRAEHRSIYKEALEGYKEKLRGMVDEVYEKLKMGEIPRVTIAPQYPVDQTKEYDRTIKMLEMCTETNVELTELDFAQYVMDEWSWMDHFITSNSAYSAKARVKNK